MPVGQTVAVIGEAGEDVSLRRRRAPAAAPRRPRAERTRRRALPSRPATAAPSAATNGGRIKASPLARRIARERGIELAPSAAPARTAGSSPRTSSAPRLRRRRRRPRCCPVATGEVESVPLTNIRKTIARRLTAAWTVPGVRADRLRRHDPRERARRARRASATPTCASPSPTCSSRCARQALARHPDVNVQFTDEALLRFPTANVGIAVATDAGARRAGDPLRRAALARRDRRARAPTSSAARARAS